MVFVVYYWVYYWVNKCIFIFLDNVVIVFVFNKGIFRNNIVMWFL